MQSMAPKKPRATENLNVWVRTELADQLREFVDGTRPRTTKTAVVEELLEIGLAMPADLFDALRAAAANGWSDLSKVVAACNSLEDGR